MRNRNNLGQNLETNSGMAIHRLLAASQHVHQWPTTPDHSYTRHDTRIGWCRVLSSVSLKNCG